MKKRNLNTLIIGCGNIAGRFDLDRKGLPLTHAGAYMKHGKFDIVGCVDPNKKRLEQFAKKWSIKNLFLSLEGAHLFGLNIDVISICSDTKSHYEIVRQAIKLKPRLIFCEKPLASRYKEAVDITKMCKKAGILLMVNHTRRWDPKVIELKNDIVRGKLGKIRSVIGYYNKGILNNGSHLIDLILYFFNSLKVVSATSAVNDQLKKDPTVTALLNTNSGLPVSLVTAHASDYSMFELQIIASKKIITIKNGGLIWSIRSINEDNIFKGYKYLKKEKYTKGKYLKSMIGAINNIYNALTKGDRLLCTGEEACAAHKICHDLSKIALINYKKKI